MSKALKNSLGAKIVLAVILLCVMGIVGLVSGYLVAKNANTVSISVSDQYERLTEMYREKISQILSEGEFTDIEGFQSTVQSVERQIDKQLDHQKLAISRSRYMIIIDIIFLLIVTLLSVFYTRIRIINPTKRANNKLQEIIDDVNKGNADLSQRINVETKDEIGTLVGNVNQFIEALQEIINVLVQQSDALGKSVNSVMGEIDISNEHIVGTTATIEELAASMEEISATTISLNQTTKNVSKEIEKISSEAISSANNANQMRAEAERMSGVVQERQDKTRNEIEEISINLKSSIEHSKQVDKVNELTDDILNIASQTNLLALNASIEAARAGEVGKGFAVVADEIRGLAESSRDTANKIQEITGIVTGAVSTLASSAEEVLTVVNKLVMEDYERFYNVAIKYKNDTGSFNEIMSDFANKANWMQEIIQNMSHSMEGISNTIEESTTGITHIAETSNQIVKGMDHINAEMKQNEEIAACLREEVNKFQAH